MKEKIYLSGTISESGYRMYVQKLHGNKYNLIDPLKIAGDYKKDTPNDIIVRDKKLIQESDILLAYIKKPTFGTIMEIMYAHVMNIPIFVINPNGLYFNDIWLSAHSNKICTNFEMVFYEIELFLNNKNKKIEK